MVTCVSSDHLSWCEPPQNERKLNMQAMLMCITCRPSGLQKLLRVKGVKGLGMPSSATSASMLAYCRHIARYVVHVSSLDRARLVLVKYNSSS
jgi:hypothetical protein